ncbi:hypothetical protein PFISCL1PPCAC_10746 [Pristionchus fissidentatus]|uniref:NADP-dependent oxidoreductase domain-containing protein n=1 Tax=Pristionchus fissidentatus TaxID=1538716 RepID=A0AAV5VNV2_9BILA|nr:hypothetical protein PFISCL1PPCAC_10746 [Pristionchus fissidentatus]
MPKLDSRAADYVKERMPMIGVGTYQVRSESILTDTIDEAFKLGYRFIDTAQIYRNEAVLGRILPDLLDKHSLTREDIFITSKVSPVNQGKGKTSKSVLKSLEELKMPYIDLVLIHWPGTSRLKSNHKDNAKFRAETYAELEDLMGQGKIRSIGVSNYEINHLETLLEQCRILPAVNQCECHPHFRNTQLAEYCKKKGIHFQAYSSLGGPDYVADLLKDEAINKIAKTHKTTTAVILLAWGLAQGYSILPRTEKVKRIGENWSAKEVKLSEEEMKSIESIDKSNKACWDPSVVV